MNHISAGTGSNNVELSKRQMTVEGSHLSKGDMIVRGIGTAVAATTMSPTTSGAPTCPSNGAPGKDGLMVPLSSIR